MSSDLCKAAAAGDVETIELLLTMEDIDVNATSNAGGQTAVHVAAEAGKTEAVQTLGRFGADMNIQDDRYRTPLFYAATTDSSTLNLIRALVSFGADVNAREDRQHYTPLHFAAKRSPSSSSRRAIGALLSCAADVDAKGWRQVTPLYLAIQSLNIDAAKLLVRGGADVHACCREDLVSKRKGR